VELRDSRVVRGCAADSNAAAAPEKESVPTRTTMVNVWVRVVFMVAN